MYHLGEGRLSRNAIMREIDGSQKRLGTDYLDFIGKYDRMEEADIQIVNRVHQLAQKYQCKMSQIAIAWHWAKGVAAPIIGATKSAYLDEVLFSLLIFLLLIAGIIFHNGSVYIIFIQTHLHLHRGRIVCKFHASKVIEEK